MNPLQDMTRTPKNETTIDMAAPRAHESSMAMAEDERQPNFRTFLDELGLAGVKPFTDKSRSAIRR